MAESYITESMLDMFLYESSQNLETLENLAMECDKSGELSEAGVNEIFRIMHTLKGSSGIMMYNDITTCAHSLEDVFYYIRESKPDNIPVSDVVALVFDSCEFISSELDKIRDGGQPDGSSESLVAKNKAFLERLKKQITDGGDALPKDTRTKGPEVFYIAPAVSGNANYFHVTIKYRSDTEMANVRAYTAVFSLKNRVDDMYYIPEELITDESVAEVIINEGFHLYIKASVDEEELMRMIGQSSGVVNIDVERISAEEYANGGQGTGDKGDVVISLDEEPAEQPKKKSTRKSKKKPAESEVLLAPPAEEKPVSVSDMVKKAEDKNVKEEKAVQKPLPSASKQTFISVNVSKMDEIMDLVGELVIAESVVVNNPDLQGINLELPNFQKASAQLRKIIGDLQEVVMGMRMLPLAPTFQKMNRIVFDVSRKLGKDIDLDIIGENTEVDKNIIEHISDPLMHLVRNSVDHGIETREERAKTTKPQRGKITLEAKNEGGKVWIIVKDDGGGLNRDKILAKAKANGLLGNRNEKDLTDKEIYNFITLPGFSTKEQVTEYSGRGVGMDVVVQSIQDVGGSLEIDSVPGEGSTMTIKIPLTLAIVKGVILKIGSSSYVMPTGDISEFVCIEKKDLLVEPEGNESIMIRGECYPVIRLKEYYHLSEGFDDVEQGTFIIAEYEGTKAAFFVDDLISEQEIVVKPLPPYIKKIKGLSGCTQLGDGSISLILDVGNILKGLELTR
jgi:two-component system chemotaxis sensor kinase CheA